MSTSAYRYEICTQRNTSGLLDMKKYDDAFASLYIEFRKTTGSTQPTDEELVKNLKNRLQHGWIAVILAIEENSNQLVGYTSLGKLDEETMQLSSTFVKSAYRNKGIFTAMYEQTIQFAKALGSQYLCVETANPDLRKFLEKEGFQILGESLLLQKKV